MVAPELAFAEELCKVLKAFGSAQLQYITAEFQPFSNQQRPDIVFVPRMGGFRGQCIFVEIKLSTKALRSGFDFKILQEHKQFALEAIDKGALTRYIYVCSDLVPEFSKKLLSHDGIVVVDGVTTTAEVVRTLTETGILPISDGVCD